MSYTPQTDLWLERSRLDGMMLGAASYGGFFFLTVQAATALVRRPRYGGKIARHRVVLLFYILITFMLGTVGFAANARYTEMIWIDLRDAPGGPAALINDEFNYKINVLALTCYYIMEWFMQVLLLHRCFVIWDWARCVTIPMITLYIAMIAMSIIVLIEASTGIVWYNINIELAYLCIEVGLTVIYTILTANRLLVIRNQMKQIMPEYDSSTYDIVVLVVVESAVLYSVFAIIFIVSFALHSNVSNLCFLSISHVQGIAQLLIIIRVARGRTYTHEWSTRVAAAPTSVAFSGTVFDTSNVEATLEQHDVQSHAPIEVNVSICTT
ncbi:hypothetical protein P692DRAFT_20870413 [Suillus brevipes Sb2]|nr:hypothetical protein P692DRAFT_20870413 [Suillus brevipes Sb2]